MDKKSTYVYKAKNIKLQVLRKKIKACTKGLFFVVGKTGAGKTEFLKSVVNEMNSGENSNKYSIGWYSYQDVVQHILSEFYCEENGLLSFDEDIIIIENMEDLTHKEYTRQEVIELLVKHSKEKTIVCTSTIQFPEMNKGSITYVYRMRVNRKLIRSFSNIILADKLTKEEKKLLKGKKIKNIYQLIGELKKIALIREMDKKNTDGLNK